MKKIATLAIGAALLSAAPAVAASRTPRVSMNDGRQFAADVARNLGGGVVTRCERRSRYFVRCRADLAVSACHVWAHVHAHNGAVYWPMPRFAYCDDGSTIRL